MRILPFALAVGLASSQSLGAQLPPEIVSGARVRVVLPDSLRQASAPTRDQWIRGRVARLTADTLFLGLGGVEAPIAIRHAAIKRIDRSLGVPSRGESALRGAVGWALFGALFGLATGWPEFDEGVNERNAGDRAALGAAWGAGVGFVLGALFPSERWRRVRMR
jgi:hypothetical protein